jgi:sulfite exporter TauE/SafE
MEYAGISDPAAAFVAGLTTSLHCTGMCGPLACALASTSGDTADPQLVSSVYQGARVLGYALLGALAGAIGQAPLSLLGDAGLRVAPWIFAAFFLLIAFRLDKRLPRFAWLTRVQFSLQQTWRGRSRLAAAAGIGFATPLLPCGPLHFIVTISAFAGSAVRGAEFMLAFALGTLPLLWLAQANYGRLRARWTPRTLARVQTSVALLAFVVMAWRLRGTLGFGGPGLDSLLCHWSQ